MSKRGESAPPACVQWSVTPDRKTLPRKNLNVVVGMGVHQRIESKTSSIDRFSYVPNFGCENSGQCEKRLQPPRNPHLMERILDIGRTDKSVLRVFKRSLISDMAKSFACEQRSMEVSNEGWLLVGAPTMNRWAPSFLETKRKTTSSTASSGNPTDPALTRSRTKAKKLDQYDD